MDILDAAGRAGVVLKKVSTNGKEWAGPCPKCAGSDRFHVWPDGKGGHGNYWCRRCDIKGDLVQFLVDFLGYEYKAAFDAAGREMPANYKPVGQRPAGSAGTPVFEPKHYEDPVETWQIKASELIAESHIKLLTYPEAMEYLKNRGLDEKAVRAFKLGWHEGERDMGCRFRPRSSWGLKDIFKNDGKKKKLWIPRGFIIPCFKDGLVYRIRIRRPKKDLKKKSDVKYFVLPGSGMELLTISLDKACQVIVEAELDALMIARHAGSLVGVVALGSARNKPGDTVFHRLKKAMRILDALDHDKAAQLAWPWWEENFKNVRLWPVPEGKDPGEAYLAGVDIKAWIKLGLPPAATMDEHSRGYTPPPGLYPMQELKYLLTTYPITIQAEEKKARVIVDPGFKNRAILARVDQLFFGDDEIQWYLRIYHPASMIDGTNCEVVRND